MIRTIMADSFQCYHRKIRVRVTAMARARTRVRTMVRTWVRTRVRVKGQR